MAARKRFSVALLVLGLLFLLSLGGVLLLRFGLHHRTTQEGRHRARVAARGPKVFVAPVEATPPRRDVTLPAEVRAFFMSTLYAKIPGYMKTIRVDKGDPVKEGEVLATIESPETDRLILGAEADLAAKRRLYRRMSALLKGQFVAPQEVVNAKGEMELARSTLEHLQVLQAYEVVKAPFTGLITARYVDPGALIPAPMNATEAAMPVVDIALLDRVRIAVYVGQDISGYVEAGTPATITQDGRPEVKIDASVTRTAGAVDPRSRTMLCEIWLENPTHLLQPGTFVRVTLHLKPPPVATVPSEALFVRNDVPLAAVVREKQVQFVRVKPGIDDGVHVQVLSGLKVGETVALNLPADLEEGAAIQPVSEKPSGGILPSQKP